MYPLIGVALREFPGEDSAEDRLHIDEGVGSHS